MTNTDFIYSASNLLINGFIYIDLLLMLREPFKNPTSRIKYYYVTIVILDVSLLLYMNSINNKSFISTIGLEYQA
jgi:hypothetical protein